MTEDEKLEAIVPNMELETIMWFQWEYGRQPLEGWVELKQMMLEFKSSQEGTMYEALLVMRQEGSCGTTNSYLR